MELTIPIFNETIKKPGQDAPVFRVCALFQQAIHAEDINLRRAYDRLSTRLRKVLDPEGRSWNHNELSRFSFNPDIQSKRLKLELDLKSRRAKASIFFVTFRLLDRYVAFAPAFPELWFDLDRPTELAKRAHEVFEDFFRKVEKNDEDSRKPEHYDVQGDTWISWLDLNVRTDPVSKAEMEKNLLALFSAQTMDGATELNTVGRCLDRAYPDELQRSLLRETEIEELDRLLQHPNRRPVLIVGPHLVGKTALVNEVVYRRVDRRRKKNSTKNNVWFLSPQRLISGMSYVGQWEDRLLAILKESKKRDHVLYFDDLISMFRAGQSRESNLCVADLMKNSIQERQVRVVAEITNEALHVLETRDRGFADLFHIIRLKPTDTQQTREIGIRMVQELERKNRCYFDWQVVLEAIRIQERYVTTSAMPGKLVKYLEELAAQWRNNRVAVYDVNRLFRVKTGLSGSMLGNEAMEVTEIRAKFKNKIIGQNRAVDVACNVVATARAGLNEANRPLATLLFPGPTGVGKTECAKAMADVMFAGDTHLIRFDLNQFKTAWSASTLVGTPDQPEGLLTSAVRQQPYSVVLLDEIEKAHPAVFDVLLQVLGEGRLTDALGRTADFSNCVIVMTSNLGTRRNQHGVGFVVKDEDERYIKAARDFFRPEFYNRIDEIVPFTTLSRPEIRRIARKLVADIVGREGLRRRNCVVNIGKSAIDHVVDLGYHPELGARAMKRALETQFTRRISRTLASTPVDQPTIVNVRFQNDELSVDTKPVEQAALTRPAEFSLTAAQTVQRTERLLERVESQHLANRPPGEISSDGISPELLKYFSLVEQRNRVEQNLDELKEAIKNEKSAAPPAVATQTRARTSLSMRSVSNLGVRVMKEVMAARDIGTWLDENQSTTTIGPLTAMIEKTIDQSAVLDAMVNDKGPGKVVLFLRSLNPGAGQIKHENNAFNYLPHNIASILKIELGFEVTRSSTQDEIDVGEICNWILIEGPFAESAARQFMGTYMHISSAGGFTIEQVGMVPHDLLEEKGIEKALLTIFDSTESDAGEHPATEIQPARCLYVEIDRCIDFPTGITTREFNWKTHYASFLRGFPLPPEMLDDQTNETANQTNPGD